MSSNLMQRCFFSKELHEVHKESLNIMANQSIAVIVLLPETKKWLDGGVRASGKSKELLDRLATNVQEKNLTPCKCLHDAMLRLT